MKKCCNTIAALVLVPVIFCMWTYWPREPKAAVVSHQSFSGIAIAAQDIFSYASWTDRDFTGGELVRLSLSVPSEQDPELRMTIRVHSRDGLTERRYVFEDLQFIREENGSVIFSVKQKNDIHLAQSD